MSRHRLRVSGCRVIGVTPVNCRVIVIVPASNLASSLNSTVALEVARVSSSSSRQWLSRHRHRSSELSRHCHRVIVIASEAVASLSSLQ